MQRFKKKKIFKCLCTVLVLSFNLLCFASVIADNDGAIFVTKAEFEELKQSFADQIDNYNNSIDKKIDGAIGGYLAGVRLEKDEKIDCYLDDEGKYNNKYYIYWNGESGTRAINDDRHYVLFDLFFDVLDWVKSGDQYWGGQFLAKKIHNESKNVNMDPYNVAKIVKIKLENNTNEYRLKYEKVNNSMRFNLFFQFPCASWSLNTRTGAADGGELWNLLELNGSDLKQNNLNNNLMTYFRSYNDLATTELWSVWKQCYATLNQEESDTDTLILFPFSTAKEKCWDPEDNSTVLEWQTGGETWAVYADKVGVPRGVWANVNETSATSWAVKMPKWINVPWQILNDTVDLKERKIHNLIEIDKKNSCAKEGIVLGQIPDQSQEMKLVVKGKASTDGIVYLYVGDKAVSNWTTAEFKGMKKTVEADKDFEFEYENIERNQVVWMLFKNNDASNNGLVSIKDFLIRT